MRWIYIFVLGILCVLYLPIFLVLLALFVCNIHDECLHNPLHFTKLLSDLILFYPIILSTAVSTPDNPEACLYFPDTSQRFECNQTDNSWSS